MTIIGFITEEPVICSILKLYYFSLNKDKKTRLIYLGDKRVNRARQYSAT